MVDAKTSGTNNGLGEGRGGEGRGGEGRRWEGRRGEERGGEQRGGEGRGVEGRGGEVTSRERGDKGSTLLVCYSPPYTHSALVHLSEL